MTCGESIDFCLFGFQSDVQDVIDAPVDRGGILGVDLLTKAIVLPSFAISCLLNRSDIYASIHALTSVRYAHGRKGNYLMQQFVLT